MAIKKATETDTSINIPLLQYNEASFTLIGRTPFYFNAMSTKAKQTLLAGGGKKTAAEKKELKHDPEREFVESVYVKEDGPTLLGFPASAIKGAMATAALETAGITKTTVQRLLFLPQDRVSMWGIPELKCDIVRSADMNKTPDVRTRAYVKEWVVEVDLQYIFPTLNITSVISLLANAGQIVGIGDFRQEKGRGNFGTFSVVQTDQLPGSIFAEDVARIKGAGRVAQEYALRNPVAADAATNDLLDFLGGERAKRVA